MHFYAASAAPVMRLLDWAADSRSERSFGTGYDRATLGVAFGMLATGEKVGARHKVKPGDEPCLDQNGIEQHADLGAEINKPQPCIAPR
jgi:hypothetical protein